MRCPTLAELPPPPPGKTGWPWTVESPQLPETMPDDRPWPRISIVTPSYNQGQFIEETIRSILLQGYPDLEYIVMDGGSTDESVAIIEKYSPWLTHWASEKDRGQSDAIMKGVRQATGSIIHWINSDDLLTELALAEVAVLSDGGIVIAATGVINFADDQTQLVCNANVTKDSWIRGRTTYHQPGFWLNRSAWESAGSLPISLNYAFDLAHLFQVMKRSPQILYGRSATVRFRLHPSSKTVSESGRFHRDIRSLYRRLQCDPEFRDLRHFFTAELRRFAAMRLVSRVVRMRGASGVAMKDIIAVNRLAPSLKLLRFSIGAIGRQTGLYGLLRFKRGKEVM